MSIPLPELLERLRAHGLWEGDGPAPGELRVRGVRTDSRRVAPGDLFCALRGNEGDGHRFLAAAAERGAVGALVEELRPDAALPQWRVRDGRLATAHAAGVVWGDPWEALTLVGVTGTNGKTTTTAILRHLLATRAPAASLGTLGAIGADGGVISGTEGLTTPGPAEFAERLRHLVDEGVRGVAMEVSSHALDQERVAAARFDAAVFTNLSRDHLDYHGSTAAYRAAKLRLAELLKPGAAAVVNADDPAWCGARAPGGRIVRFGIGAPADVRAEGVTLGPDGVTWTLVTPEGSCPVRLPLLGAFNVANALAAAATMWTLGWSADRIAAGLETVPQVPGRLERVATPAGFPSVVIDYAHTPDALARAIEALRPLAPGRLVVVFGAGGDRDRGKRAEMGRVAAAGADLAVVTSDNPRSEDPDRIADDIERGMGDAPRLRLRDRRDAIRRAVDEAGDGGLVLLAGKGHETYQIWGDERRPFDEREVVRQLLPEWNPR